MSRRGNCLVQTMKFFSVFLPRIRNGEKTQTRRLADGEPRYKVGDIVLLQERRGPEDVVDTDILIEIKAHRREPLQEMSVVDAVAEGCWLNPPMSAVHSVDPPDFRDVWHSIYAADGPHGWNANPLVDVYTFRRVS